MIIGIDASALTLDHPTGVQRYVEQIILNLINIGSPTHTFRLYTPKTLPEPFNKHQVVIRSPRFWTQLRLPLELILHKPDVFFQPSYMMPPIVPCRSVAAVHDVAWTKFPNAYSTKELTLQRLTIKRLLKTRSAIISPSLSTKNDLVSVVGVGKLAISVIPDALVNLPKPNPSAEHKTRYKDRPIVLAIGRFEERKNTTTLINAFSNLITSTIRKDGFGKLPVLILIGHPGFGAEKVFDAISRAKKMGAEIIIVKNATEQLKADWLSLATVFVYPSLYEGFGFPILEAFSAEVPVITSRNSSIPEVGGDAVLYLNNSENEDELAAAINSIIYNPAKAKKLVDAGRDQLKNFSWETTAQKTLDILTGV
jgi:glycosyltransferase involved in cell wall biosynthesis